MELGSGNLGSCEGGENGHGNLELAGNCSVRVREFAGCNSIPPLRISS